MGDIGLPLIAVQLGHPPYDDHIGAGGDVVAALAEFHATATNDPAPLAFPSRYDVIEAERLLSSHYRADVALMRLTPVAYG